MVVLAILLFAQYLRVFSLFKNNYFLFYLASIKMKFPEIENNTISNRIGRVLAGSCDWDGNRWNRKRKKSVPENNPDEI